MIVYLKALKQTLQILTLQGGVIHKIALVAKK
jgi:hypothetical protein